jgi:hypothetical protein
MERAVTVGLGIGAQRSEVRCGVEPADHRQRTSVMLAVERREASEPATGSVGGIVEPEPDIERVHGRDSPAGVESEDLVKQDRLDRDLALTVVIRMQIGLVPREAEVAALEVGIGRAVGGELRAVLDGEDVEVQVGLEIL